MKLTLRCQCGRIRGAANNVSPAATFRFVCYCKDCRAFVRLLGRTDVLDPAGGLDIVQMAPARVTIDTGAEELRCLSFSANVLRWYSNCCRTPIANGAASMRFPMMGLICSCVDREAVGLSLDAALGPPLCRIFERSATAAFPRNTPPPPSLRLFARRTIKLTGWWAQGLATPNPFFDVATKRPRSTPQRVARTDNSLRPENG